MEVSQGCPSECEASLVLNPVPEPHPDRGARSATKPGRGSQPLHKCKFDNSDSRRGTLVKTGPQGSNLKSTVIVHSTSMGPRFVAKAPAGENGWYCHWLTASTAARAS